MLLKTRGFFFNPCYVTQSFKIFLLANLIIFHYFITSKGLVGIL